MNSISKVASRFIIASTQYYLETQGDNIDFNEKKGTLRDLAKHAFGLLHKSHPNKAIAIKKYSLRHLGESMLVTYTAARIPYHVLFQLTNRQGDPVPTVVLVEFQKELSKIT